MIKRGFRKSGASITRTNTMKKTFLILLGILFFAIAYFTFKNDLGLQAYGALILFGFYTISLALFGTKPPNIAYELSGGKLTHDDDPRNIPIKIYLPIILFGIVGLTLGILYQLYL